MGERWYWRTFWTLVMAVLVAGGIVWLVNSHTSIGPNTASYQPTVTTPATPPAMKPEKPLTP